MKRPEGFDENRPATPPAPKGRNPPKAQKAQKAERAPKVQNAPKAKEAPGTPKASKARGGGKRDTPTPRRGQGEKRARAADRERKRYERAEMRRFTRRARRRRIGWIVALGLVVTLIALVAVAVYSPILALRTIRVDGTVRLDAAELAEAVSGQDGVPLALIDEDRIRRELGEFALIRSYVTELVPPDTMLIHIVERSPIGVVQSAAGFEVVDPAGIVLETSSTRPPGVPLLQVGDDGIEGTGFLAMAEVLLALPPAVLAQVDTITARTRDDVTMSIAGTQQRVVWGSADESGLKARVLAVLLAHFGASGPGEYDVSAPGNPVFRAD